MESSANQSNKEKQADKSSPRKATQLTNEAHNHLEKQSKRLGIKNQEYASAAINYFAETGLDPRKMSKASLAKIESSILNETFDVREHTATIGNRLVGVIRTFERNMGTMLQQQQGGIFKHLESIERNLLTYLVNVEENLLNTILERVLAGNVENYVNRMMLQIVSLQLDTKRFPFSEAELSKLTSSYDEQRDRQIVVEGRKLLETKKVSRPKTSVAPSLVEIPKAPAPNKPTTGAPAAGPTASATAPTPATPK